MAKLRFTIAEEIQEPLSIQGPILIAERSRVLQLTAQIRNTARACPDS